MFNSTNTLVKYTNPILVETKTQQKTPRVIIPKYARDNFVPSPRDSQDVLNRILPPKEWQENGQLWRQQVSSEPATRGDVIKLGEALDRKLEQKRAKEAGICTVRRELFTQAFDEVIRQVTVNCAEQGLLLLRVRNEMRKTILSFTSLYESCIAYGMRKALMAEQEKLDLAQEIEKIKDDNLELNKSLNQLKQNYDSMVRKNTEVQKTEIRKHQDELNSLKSTNSQIKAQLEAIIAPKAKEN